MKLIIIPFLLSASLWCQSMILPGQTYTASTTNYIISVPLMNTLLDYRKESTLKSELLDVQAQKALSLSNEIELLGKRQLILSNTIQAQTEHIVWLEKVYRPNKVEEWWYKNGPIVGFVLGVVGGAAATIELSKIIQITVVK